MRVHACVKVAVIALLCCSPVRAQEQQGNEQLANDEIVVTGIRESTLDLPRLLRAQNEFGEGRATFAPTSSLYFQLRPAAGISVDGMTLTLVNGEQRIPVPIDADQRFTLPDLTGRGWELVHNRRAGRIAVRAVVLSAGSSETDRRMGDLRLQCRAGWELAKANFSFVARTGFGVMGGCSSSKFAFYFRAPPPITSSVLTHQGETRELPLRADRSAYRAPISDRLISNDARVTVRYD